MIETESKRTRVVHKSVWNMYEVRTRRRKQQSATSQEGGKMYAAALKRLVISGFSFTVCR